MKTSTFKSLIAIAAICLMSFPLFAQDFVGMRIDVIGSRYSDQMWMFSVPSCTTGFDNGWDGYKMIGTNSYAPVIYASEVSGNYQVDAVADFNSTNIAFIGGEDSQYTFSFYSENLTTTYQHLYLVDLVANKTIDILNSGVIYTFTVNKATDPLIRFKLITALPVDPTTPVATQTPADTTVVTPPANSVVVTTPTDPVVTDPVVTTNPVTTTPTDPAVTTTPVTTTPTNPVVTTNPVTTTPTDPVACNDKNKDKKAKKLKITCSKKTITIENTGKGRGNIQVYNALNGRMVETGQINGNGKTIIVSKSSKGTYVVRGTTTDDDVTETILIQ
jgi:hypothetical protein